MRCRFASLLLLFAFLLSLCACRAALPQQVRLSPFSADLRFTEDETVFDGVFTVENAQSMQLLLRAPRELQGLSFVFENGKTSLRFGDAALSLRSAEALFLRPAAVAALFEALSALEQARTLSDSLTLALSTARGTATLRFSPQLLPQQMELGGVTFQFSNMAMT